MQHAGPSGISAGDQQHQKVNITLDKNVMGKRKRSGSFSKTDDSGAKKSDDCDSQEELDFENVSPLIRGFSNSATRCSARVQEKQEKLRREASPSKQIISTETNCPLTATSSSVSSVPKGNTKHSVPTLEDPTGCHHNETGTLFITSSVGLEEKRKKRNWELWSVEDKQLFFEALNEFGKDFDAIQNYLATKLKPRSKSIACSQYAPKNKDQVRHFYYRTWNKLSKHLRFPPDMKKASQELYGLINYGELRKKQRVLNSKSAVKLCELVENGITSIKFRGKTCRIKTPVCRALKRLNGLEDVEHTRVPHKLGVEFIPRDGKTWRAVQSVSHNPRVKVYVSLQRTLASIIAYFEDRWKRNEDRLKEQFSTVFGKPRSRLRAIPIDTRELNIPVFRVAENTSSTTICLRAYTEHILSRERSDEIELAATKLKRKRKQSGGSGPNAYGIADPNCNVLTSLSSKHLEAPDYSIVDGDNSDVESQFLALCQTSKSSKTTNLDVRFTEEQSNEMAWMRFEKKWHDHEDRHEAMGIRDTEIVNATTETDNDDVDHDPDDAPLGCQLHIEADDQLCACGSGKPAEPENFVSHVWDDERIRQGWTSEEAGVMTIGEIYLMLGQTEKLCFEYSWDTLTEDGEDARSRNLIERLITTARLLKKKKSSRSKAVLLNSSAVVNSGSLITCSKCGTKAEVPANVQNHFKEGPITCALNNTALATSQSFSKIKGHHSMAKSEQGSVNVVPSVSITSSDSPNPGGLILGSEPGATAIILEETEFTNRNINTASVTGAESSVGAVEAYPNTAVKAEDTKHSSQKMSNIAPDADKIDASSDKISKRLGNSNLDVSSSTSTLGRSTLLKLQSSLTTLKKGLIELTSSATKHGRESNSEQQSLAPNIKAVLLPKSSTMLKSTAGSVSISHAEGSSNHNTINSEVHRDTVNTNEISKPSCVATPLDMLQGPKESQNFSSGNSSIADSIIKEQTSFRRPASVQIAVRPKEASGLMDDHSKLIPPKPFLDLPKGNRRLGRRPNFKRVVIPRVLPLLPKADELLIRGPVPVTTILSLGTVGTSGSGIMTNSSGSSSVLIPITASASSSTSVALINLVGNNKISQCSVNVEKCEMDSGASSSNSAVDARQPGRNNIKNDKNSLTKLNNTGMYSEAFLGSVPGSISCSSNDFEDLLKVRQQESSSNMAAGDMDSLSLSSFMEISLPESARMAANECINTDLHIDDLENSNCSLSLSNILNSEQKSLPKDLAAPEKQPDPVFQPTSSNSEASTGLSNLSNFETPWHLEPGEMSLSSIFGSYDSARGASGLSETEMNFQSMMSDNSLDFVSKLTGLSSPMSDSRK